MDTSQEKTLRTPLILVVDDAAEIRVVLRTFLELHGYDVEEAGDGDEAVTIAAHVRPDLILMDLDMPVFNGIEAIRHIRLSRELQSVPVIIHTAHGELGINLYLQIDDLGQGLIEYITKPLDFDYLLDLLSRVLPVSKD